MPINLPQVPFKLTQEDMGVPNLMDYISKGLKTGLLTQSGPADIQSTLLKNVYQKLVNQYYPQDIQSQIGLRGAQAGHLNAETPWIGPQAQAAIGYQNSQTDLNKLKIKYPGLGEAGIVGQLAMEKMLRDTQSNSLDQSDMQAQQPNQDVSYSPMSQANNPSVTNGLLQNMTPINQFAQDTDNIAQAITQAQGRQAAIPPLGSLAKSVSGQLASDPNSPLAQIQRSINAGINKDEAQAKYYNQGGGRAGVDIQNQRGLLNNLANDNADFSEDDLREAATNLSQGIPTLSDGRPINMSFLTKQSLQKVMTQGIPAAVTAQIQQANQADAELKVFSDNANKFLQPYGDTYLGKSPQQIADTFKSDTASQNRLGDFVAGQAIQYEIAQIRNRIAGGRPGVTSTQQLLNESKQHLDTLWPHLSEVSRKRASDQINRVLDEGLQARNAVYRNPLGVGGNTNSSNSDEMIKVKVGGKEGLVHKSQLDTVKADAAKQKLSFEKIK